MFDLHPNGYLKMNTNIVLQDFQQHHSGGMVLHFTLGMRFQELRAQKFQVLQKYKGDYLES